MFEKEIIVTQNKMVYRVFVEEEKKEYFLIFKNFCIVNKYVFNVIEKGNKKFIIQYDKKFDICETYSYYDKYMYFIDNGDKFVYYTKLINDYTEIDKLKIRTYKINTHLIYINFYENYSELSKNKCKDFVLISNFYEIYKIYFNKNDKRYDIKFIDFCLKNGTKLWKLERVNNFFVYYNIYKYKDEYFIYNDNYGGCFKLIEKDKLLKFFLDKTKVYKEFRYFIFKDKLNLFYIYFYNNDIKNIEDIKEIRYFYIDNLRLYDLEFFYKILKEGVNE